MAWHHCYTCERRGKVGKTSTGAKPGIINTTQRKISAIQERKRESGKSKRCSLKRDERAWATDMCFMLPTA